MNLMFLISNCAPNYLNINEKMKIVLYFLILTLLYTQNIFAGDTLRVMQYNLLYYDMNTQWCTSSNNSVVLKDGYLRDITGHFKPDIFTVNEMNGSPTSVQRLLDNVFNYGGTYIYKRANYTGSYLVNMLYYNSSKLELKSQSYISTSPRITDVYKLYYKSNNLIFGDTVFVTCIVTHLKAGSTTEDADDRALAALQIMSYINNRNLQGNILIMGDFNVYTSSETAFQRFMTPTSTGVRFYDPVNALGDWQDNPAFALYHTQSTNITSGCPSGGGMDDRFDFILPTLPVINGTHGMQYVSGSYKAFGQDGNRFNQTIISPPNYTLPSNIVSSLYYMSDHLPVVLKLFVDRHPLNTASSSYKDCFSVSNPVNENINIWYSGLVPEKAIIRIINILGTTIKEETLFLYPDKQNTISFESFNNGIYLLVIQGEKNKEVKRIVKQ
jgi:hypothetical protein